MHICIERAASAGFGAATCQAGPDTRLHGTHASKWHFCEYPVFANAVFATTNSRKIQTNTCHNTLQLLLLLLLVTDAALPLRLL
jgi:hypothetical protein